MNNERSNGNGQPVGAKREYYRGPHRISPALQAKLDEIEQRKQATGRNIGASGGGVAPTGLPPEQRELAAGLKAKLDEIKRRTEARGRDVSTSSGDDAPTSVPPELSEPSVDLKAKLDAYDIKRKIRERHKAILAIADCAIGAALTRDRRTAEEKVITDAVAKHLIALRGELRKSLVLDPYGAILSDGRIDEIRRFLRSVGLAGNGLPIKRAVKIVLNEVNRLEDVSRTLGFNPESYPTDGHEFEAWVASSLSVFGWQSRVTRGSGDQGVDVIAVRDGITVAIQAKRYASKVGNAAVQEVFSGAMHLGIRHAVVMAVGEFTPSAMELSRSTGVLLLHVTDIPIMATLF